MREFKFDVYTSPLDSGFVAYYEGDDGYIYLDGDSLANLEINMKNVVWEFLSKDDDLEEVSIMYRVFEYKLSRGIVLEGLFSREDPYLR